MANRKWCGVSAVLLSVAIVACSSPSSNDVVIPLDIVADVSTELEVIAEARVTEAVSFDVDVETGEKTLALIAPVTIPDGVPVPLVVRVTENGKPAWWTYGMFSLDFGAGEAAQIRVTRGMGSATVDLSGLGEHEFVVGGEGLSGKATVMVDESMQSREVSGVLEGADLNWGPDEVLYAAADIEIPAGETLVIGEGTVVLLGHKANLLVQGEVLSVGSAVKPVLFTAGDAAKPWGGIIHDGSVGEYLHTFFSSGGGDSVKKFGHSNSQAVLFVKAGHLTLKNVYLLDNVGKGLGSDKGQLSVEDSLISRCDTGGELKYSIASFYRTWFLEMPSDDGVPDDDDNDGIYLAKPHADTAADEPSAVVEECVFAIGKDDGIDHNGSQVVVKSSFIEGFHHEGIACSNGGFVNAVDTLVMGCQQGIEAGYGAPEVTVDHCTLVDNEVGLRMGDSYSDPIEGTLTVTNSISVSNSEHNVWDFSNRVDGPKPGQVSISHSMVDQDDYDGQDGNLPGLPVFDSSYHLEADSPGTGAASDGSDMGLL